MKSILWICVFFVKANANPDTDNANSTSTIVTTVEALTVESSTASNSPSSVISNTSTDISSSNGSTIAPQTSNTKVTSRPSSLLRRKALFNHIVQQLSDNDPKKKEQLTTAPSSFYREMNSCFMESYGSFKRFCHLGYVGKSEKYFKLLISIACDADWLNTKKICSVLRKSCQPHLFGG